MNPATSTRLPVVTNMMTRWFARLSTANKTTNSPPQVAEEARTP